MKKILYFIALTSLFGCHKETEIKPSTSGSLSVYPNPTVNFANAFVVNNSSEVYLIEVFDPKGRIILREKATNVENSFGIDLTGKESGVYEVFLDMNGEIVRQKLVKLDE